MKNRSETFSENIDIPLEDREYFISYATYSNHAFIIVSYRDKTKREVEVLFARGLYNQFDSIFINPPLFLKYLEITLFRFLIIINAFTGIFTKGKIVGEWYHLLSKGSTSTLSYHISYQQAEDAINLLCGPHPMFKNFTTIQEIVDYVYASLPMYLDIVGSIHRRLDYLCFISNAISPATYKPLSSPSPVGDLGL